MNEDQLYELYDEFLDEVYGDEIEVAGLHYSTSQLLKKVDQTAYLCGYNDWYDMEETAGRWSQDEESENEDES